MAASIAAIFSGVTGPAGVGCCARSNAGMAAMAKLQSNLGIADYSDPLQVFSRMPRVRRCGLAVVAIYHLPMFVNQQQTNVSIALIEIFYMLQSLSDCRSAAVVKK